MSKRAQPPTASSGAPAPIPLDTRSLVERLLDTPHAAQVIRRLQPEVLHRVVLAAGLQDSGELVALASPTQLQRVFDLDLWRSPRAGADQHLDPDRFGEWLEVLMDVGPAVAAEKLLGMDDDFVVAALAQHVSVFDGAAVAPYTTLDGEVVTPRLPVPDVLSAEVGGFLVIARRASAWDSLVSLLRFLDVERPDGFARLMRGCRVQSNAGFEADALHHVAVGGEQHVFDVAVDRERRMEQQGYATPAQARAFLQSARRLDLSGAAPPARNPIAEAYFRSLAETAEAQAREQETEPTAAEGERFPTIDNEGEMSAAVTAVGDLLADSGVVPRVRALLAAPEREPSRLGDLEAFLRRATDRDPETASAPLAELAFLTNTIASGGSLQSRAFTVREASDAAAAICNLGLENWPAAWPAAGDLIAVFQVGFAVLHRDVGMHVAHQLVAALSEISVRDRDIQFGLRQLRTSLTRHARNGEPWGAHDALEVLAILDLVAWTALTSLIAECPVMHAALGASLRSGVRAIDPQAFEFISTNAQIEVIREFLRRLPDTLTR